MLLILLESAQWIGFYGGDFIIFKPNVQRNTKFWIFFVIGFSLKFQISNSISWVMSSYLGQRHRPHYLSIKEDSLFVLFVCHDEISQTMVSFITLLEWLENFQQVEVCWSCFIMCTHMVLELMNILKNHCKFNKIKIKNFNEIWGMLLLFLENV
jgi:hypothetical protein